MAWGTDRVPGERRSTLPNYQYANHSPLLGGTISFCNPFSINNLVHQNRATSPESGGSNTDRGSACFPALQALCNPGIAFHLTAILHRLQSVRTWFGSAVPLGRFHLPPARQAALASPKNLRSIR